MNDCAAYVELILHDKQSNHSTSIISQSIQCLWSPTFVRRL